MQRDPSANEPSAYASCLHLVLSRISIATKNFQTDVRSFQHMQSSPLLSHRLPPYLETRQANVMTSKLLICSRRSNGQSSARSQTTFPFKDSLSHAIHITFGMSSSMHKPRDLSITAIRYLSIPNIQTQLNLKSLTVNKTALRPRLISFNEV